MVLLRKLGNKRRQSQSWNIVHEEGREIIKQWKDKRLRLKNANKSYHQFVTCSFSFDTVKNFLQNIDCLVIIQLGMAIIFVYAFQAFGVSFDIPLTLLVSPIIFPLAFSINTDFQRREKVLEDLAHFKSSAVMWYFCMREWEQASQLDASWMTAVRGKLKSFLFHLHEYLLTYGTEQRKVILTVMYEDFSDANQLIEKLRASKLPSNTAIVSKSIHLLYMMCQSFERLRVIREYRSPRSIRSFNKIFIMLFPILLAPYYVHLGFLHNRNQYQPYYIAVIVTLVFSVLQGVQDKLDDPFDRMNEDDINLDTINELTSGSLVKTMKRSFDFGRFSNESSNSANNANESVDPILRKETETLRNIRNCRRYCSETVPLLDRYKINCNSLKRKTSNFEIREMRSGKTEMTTTTSLDINSNEDIYPVIEKMINPDQVSISHIPRRKRKIVSFADTPLEKKTSESGNSKEYSKIQPSISKLTSRSAILEDKDPTLLADSENTIKHWKPVITNPDTRSKYEIDEIHIGVTNLMMEPTQIMSRSDQVNNSNPSLKGNLDSVILSRSSAHKTNYVDINEPRDPSYAYPVIHLKKPIEERENIDVDGNQSIAKNINSLNFNNLTNIRCEGEVQNSMRYFDLFGSLKEAWKTYSPFICDHQLNFYDKPEDRNNFLQI